jgi:hypothetical protein
VTYGRRIDGATGTDLESAVWYNGGTMPETADTVQSLRLTESDLEAKKRRLYSDIRNYPTPIAACDQHFNYLLEQQARVKAELSRVRRAIESVTLDPADQRGERH